MSLPSQLDNDVKFNKLVCTRFPLYNLSRLVSTPPHVWVGTDFQLNLRNGKGLGLQEHHLFRLGGWTNIYLSITRSTLSLFPRVSRDSY
jgi:hypothetical protein